MNAIEIKDLCFAYKKDIVLENINLQVQDKDFLAIIGPNGGGKSTLLKLILGLESLKSGSIKIFDEPISKNRSKLGYVPQNTNVNINFPIQVIEVVMMGANKQALFGYKQTEKDNALHALKQVGMKDFVTQKIGALSGGQRQRVMIARALYNNPEILLLDEPTSNIDAQGQKDIYELLKSLQKDISIVVVSHDISVVLKYASHVAYINKNITFHNISNQKAFTTPNGHFCEVELLQMLAGVKND